MGLCLDASSLQTPDAAMTLFLPALSARLCMQTWKQSSLAVALACMASVLFSVPTTACSPAMPDSSHI